jgi:hypothetical protein
VPTCCCATRERGHRTPLGLPSKIDIAIMKTYQSYVVQQKEGHPSLSGLCNFLKSQTSSQRPCRIGSLDFHSGGSRHKYREIDVNDLRSAISKTWDSSEKSLDGQILIVQDLGTHVVEVLGSWFNINPMFFAAHLHATNWDLNAQAPSQAILPSRMRKQNFVNLHYHRNVVLQTPANLPKKHLRLTNVDRKVNILPLTKHARIALVQHCCSILHALRDDKTWLCELSQWRPQRPDLLVG